MNPAKRLIPLTILCFMPVFLQARGPHVLELFTSQGCSSCPSADRYLTQLSEQDDLLVLSYHVTYWDYIGWKDPYGQRAFDQRQVTYARTIGDRVYTPQLVINGRHALVGSDRVKTRQLLKQDAHKAPALLTIDEVSLENQKLTVVFKPPEAAKEQTIVELLLVQPSGEDAVDAGENRGRKLKHTNVVRRLKHADAKEGSISIAYRTLEKEKGLFPVLLIRDLQTHQVLAASVVTL